MSLRGAVLPESYHIEEMRIPHLISRGEGSKKSIKSELRRY
jgi:hypothetical protein